MSDSFDPYRKWLGISPQDQPPDFYRLLAIELFESDPDVIEVAADGRMAQVKNFQSGKYSKLSQEILNEIAKAKICLLNSDKKAEYDVMLRRKTEKKEIVSTCRPSPDTAAIPQIPQFHSASVSSRVAISDGQRRRLLSAAIGAVFLLVLGVVFLLSRGGGSVNEGDVTGRQKAGFPGHMVDRSETSARMQSGNASNIDKVERPIGSVVLPQHDRSELEVDSLPDSLRLASAVDGTSKPADVPVGGGARRQLEDLLAVGDAEDLIKDDFDDNEHAESDSKRPLKEVTPPNKRLPVPGLNERQEVEKKVREIFQKEFGEARTVDARLALAAKLKEQAKASADAATDRFVLMQIASEVLAGAGDVDNAIKIVDQMARLYSVDPFAIKAHLLAKSIDSMQSGERSADAGQQVLNAAIELADLAVKKDEFDVARHFQKLAIAAAKRIDKTQLERELRVRERTLDRMKQRFATVKQAVDFLKREPNDPESNQTVGRWHCFTKSDWKKGLPFLAKSQNPKISILATQDMKHPTKPGEQVKLADAWWNIAQNEETMSKPGLLARATYWYEEAAPNLTGLEKMRVAKRLEKLTAIETPSKQTGSKGRGVIQAGNVALASNGTQVSGVDRGGEFLLDGLTQYDGRTGFALSNWPCEWTITFTKPYQLTHLRFLLWAHDERAYRYMITASPDGEEYHTLTDRSKLGSQGWQRITFPAQKVKSIKVFGLHNSLNEGFHLVEFEAYSLAPKR
jgi:hypothetical protein